MADDDPADTTFSSSAQRQSTHPGSASPGLRSPAVETKATSRRRSVGLGVIFFSALLLGEIVRISFLASKDAASYHAVDASPHHASLRRYAELLKATEDEMKAYHELQEAAAPAGMSGGLCLQVSGALATRLLQLTTVRFYATMLQSTLETGKDFGELFRRYANATGVDDESDVVLYVLWDLNLSCNARFETLFRSIPGVKFVYRAQRQARREAGRRDPGAWFTLENPEGFENCREVRGTSFGSVLTGLMMETPSPLLRRLNWRSEGGIVTAPEDFDYQTAEYNSWRALEPAPAVQRDVQEFVERHNIHQAGISYYIALDRPPPSRIQDASKRQLAEDAGPIRSYMKLCTKWTLQVMDAYRIQNVRVPFVLFSPSDDPEVTAALRISFGAKIRVLTFAEHKSRDKMEFPNVIQLNYGSPILVHPDNIVVRNMYIAAHALEFRSSAGAVISAGEVGIPSTVEGALRTRFMLFAYISQHLGKTICPLPFANTFARSKCL